METNEAKESEDADGVAMMSCLFGESSESDDDPSKIPWEADTFEAFGKKIKVLEGYADTRGDSDSEDGLDESLKTWHGDVVWPAASILLKAFERAFPTDKGGLAGKTILELGSGTGVLGLSLGAGGARVTLTDLPENVKLVRENIRRNIDAGIFGDAKPRCKILHWAKPESIEKVVDVGFDYIIASDCIYDRKVACMLFRALAIATRHALSRRDAKSGAPRVIVCNKGRWYRGVLSDIRRWFTVLSLSPRDLGHIDMEKSMTSHSDEWDASAVCDANIHVFELRLKDGVPATAKRT